MGRFAFTLPIVGFTLALILTASSGPAADSVSARRLFPPSCLDTETAPALSYREEGLRIASGELTLAGRLFLPDEPGPHPAVVLLHGGGLRHLNDAPLFYGPLLATCGVAALVYDKRGTGASGGGGARLFSTFLRPMPLPPSQCLHGAKTSMRAGSD